MEIVGVYNVSNSDSEIFYEELIKAINILQRANQEVEVQYSTNVSKSIKGGIVYSALVLGRK